jgi:hypothetical protein
VIELLLSDSPWIVYGLIPVLIVIARIVDARGATSDVKIIYSVVKREDMPKEIDYFFFSCPLSENLLMNRRVLRASENALNFIF